MPQEVTKYTCFEEIGNTAIPREGLQAVCMYFPRFSQQICVMKFNIRNKLFFFLMERTSLRGTLATDASTHLRGMGSLHPSPTEAPAGPGCTDAHREPGFLGAKLKASKPRSSPKSSGSRYRGARP